MLSIKTVFGNVIYVKPTETKIINNGKLGLYSQEESCELHNNLADYHFLN